MKEMLFSYLLLPKPLQDLALEEQLALGGFLDWVEFSTADQIVDILLCTLQELCGLRCGNHSLLNEGGEVLL